MTPEEWNSTRATAAEISVTLNRGLRKTSAKVGATPLAVIMALADVVAQAIVTSSKISGLPIEKVHGDAMQIIAELLTARMGVITAPGPGETEH